jgi:hypothetical protein
MEEDSLECQGDEKTNDQRHGEILVKHKAQAKHDKGWKDVTDGRTPKGVRERESDAANPTTEQEYKQRSNRYGYDECEDGHVKT